ncbi:hypothetical protein Poli38472_012146 [Pythium oligandrum]|uniref:Uncharacterized protein n=1 Tax=Pythium oligandrum TaxID=41045 RepID=A0A8K1CPC3_PYTOL|nr:hypothetical protein Poli38472_012146 [Pythium oligandrum]|eukprot:TMW67030.1 hypothetical protein Poli38472_012146 [Pythium oligandrum]
MRRSTRQRRRVEATDAVASADTEPPAPKKQRQTDAAPQEVSNAVSAVQNDPKPTENETKTLVLPTDNREEWQRVLQETLVLSAPVEFYNLFDLASHLAPSQPLEAFVESLGLRLCGPFELLARAGTTLQYNKPLCLHGRYALDPPEVVTVLGDVWKRDDGAHWGYFRDAPNQTPSYVVYASDSSTCAFSIVASSLFHVLSERMKDAKSQASQELRELVQTYIEQHGGGGKAVPSASSLQSQRQREWTAASLHGPGIVVPYNATKRQGFRELPVTGDKLRALVTKMASGDAAAKKKAGDLITRATIANDECDFGTSLLLGLDLFTAGPALEKEALKLLRVAYALLGRKAFATVASDHLKHRSEGNEAIRSFVDGTASEMASYRPSTTWCTSRLTK